MDGQKLLTDKEVAEHLNIPFNEDHIARLRSREKLPYVLFDVDGEKQYRYRPDDLAEWVCGRVLVGKRRKNGRKKS